MTLSLRQAGPRIYVALIAMTLAAGTLRNRRQEPTFRTSHR
jgi:hypothetical protein